MAAATLPDLRKIAGHKYDHGHALIIAGPSGHGGAARLAARAALRIGAGLVTLAPPADAMAEHTGPPDALMRAPLDTAGDLAALIGARRISAVLIGPGCGAERAARLLPGLADSGLPAVIDADAITALARAALPLPLPANWTLTPHQGEFTRLFPALAHGLDDQAEGRIAAATAAARDSGAVVLLKGPLSVIADPGGATRLNDARDAAQLATAGSGDVLAGIITGLLARGFPPLDAAATGAAVHAACARRFGPGLIADDLPGMIPAILREWP
ncbi:MAG: NAD(P)H-hydrate dehydratase [Paracoccus sp. (in: a-proteobacteria)]|nr:NAD(P)H-hydrate dehydratase [Paracoccus sp. (in: a-proteobacteria)]